MGEDFVVYKPWVPNRSTKSFTPTAGKLGVVWTNQCNQFQVPHTWSGVMDSWLDRSTVYVNICNGVSVHDLASLKQIGRHTKPSHGGAASGFPACRGQRTMEAPRRRTVRVWRCRMKMQNGHINRTMESRQATHRRGSGGVDTTNKPLPTSGPPSTRRLRRWVCESC
jgi:hypothetical protein